MIKHQTGTNNIVGSKLFNIIMETEIIEPHPLLIEYLEIASGLFCDFDGSKKEFIDFDEWHYVPSNLEQNIFLLKRLEEKGLLQDEINICDCGIGLGTTMYDFYLQSQYLSNKRFTFTGIEKHKLYIDYLNKKLVNHWNGNLTLIDGDIMDQNYSNYNFIYSYSPFKTEEKLIPYYQKIISEVKSGSTIIEFRNKGLGYDGILSNLCLNDSKIISHQIDDIMVFEKV